MSDLAAGMGWSIYLMLGVVALMVGSIVFLIIRSDKQRMRVRTDVRSDKQKNAAP